jgi:hypothetical protein
MRAPCPADAIRRRHEHARSLALGARRRRREAERPARRAARADRECDARGREPADARVERAARRVLSGRAKAKRRARRLRSRGMNKPVHVFRVARPLSSFSERCTNTTGYARINVQRSTSNSGGLVKRAAMFGATKSGARRSCGVECKRPTRPGNYSSSRTTTTATSTVGAAVSLFFIHPSKLSKCRIIARRH